MKVAFSTLGCRVNQYETEAMTEKFIKEGYDVVDFNEIADVYVINTCTVTNVGDKKSRQMIGRARRLNGNAVIAVVGCYSQIAPEEIADIDGVDIVLGTRNKGEIVYWINKYISDKKLIVEVNDVLRNKEFEELRIEEYQDKTRAFLKIQDGCNRFCSYCLIPFARGAVCSKKPEKIIEEVNKLDLHGFKEIILSGIHIASYGYDLSGNISLIDILEKIEDISGIERVRIGSIDPTYFNDEIIDRMANLKKLCPQFHLSLQSGCDETLKRMNRHYTAAEYKSIVDKLRAKIENVAITTDVIVGFPGENETEFNITYAFLKEIKLAKMHIFKYSSRKGTKAAKLKEQVDPRVKEERSTKLIELNKESEKEFISSFIGKTMNVLYEQRVNNEKDTYEGYTPNYIKVIAKSDTDLRGEIVNTELVEGKTEYAIGHIGLNVI